MRTWDILNQWGTQRGNHSKKRKKVTPKTIRKQKPKQPLAPLPQKKKPNQTKPNPQKNKTNKQRIKTFLQKKIFFITVGACQQWRAWSLQEHNSKALNLLSCLPNSSFSLSHRLFCTIPQLLVLRKSSMNYCTISSHILFSLLSHESKSQGVIVNAHPFHLFCVSLLVLQQLLFSMSNFESDLKSCKISCKCVEDKNSSNIDICIYICCLV